VADAAPDSEQGGRWIQCKKAATKETGVDEQMSQIVDDEPVPGYECGSSSTTASPSSWSGTGCGSGGQTLPQAAATCSADKTCKGFNMDTSVQNGKASHGTPCWKQEAPASSELAQSKGDFSGRWIFCQNLARKLKPCVSEAPPPNTPEAIGVTVALDLDSRGLFVKCGAPNSSGCREAHHSMYPQMYCPKTADGCATCPKEYPIPRTYYLGHQASATEQKYAGKIRENALQCSTSKSLLGSPTDVYCMPHAWTEAGFEMNKSPLSCIKYTQNKQYIGGQRWKVTNPGTQRADGVHSDGVPFRSIYKVSCVTSKHVRCNAQETYQADGNVTRTRRHCASTKVVSLLKVENVACDACPVRETWTPNKLHENCELASIGGARSSREAQQNLCSGIAIVG